jgi:hypothetical protein
VSVEVDRGDRRAVGLGQLVDQRTEAAGNFALRGLGSSAKGSSASTVVGVAESPV